MKYLLSLTNILAVFFLHFFYENIQKYLKLCAQADSSLKYPSPSHRIVKSTPGV